MRLIDADALKEICVYASPCTSWEQESKLIDLIDAQPTIAAPRWHRCEEPPNEDGWYMLGFLSRWKNGSWWIPNCPDYWMPTEPQKEITNE